MHPRTRLLLARRRLQRLTVPVAAPMPADSLANTERRALLLYGAMMAACLLGLIVASAVYVLGL